VQTRAKRLVLGNDENDNPFFKPPNSSSATTRSKQPVSLQQRPSSTPNKISAHFSVSKTSKQLDSKTSHLSTPQTPRHRDALTKKVTITPRHRHLISSNHSSPRTPSTPSTAASNVYNQARQLFATSTDPGVLIGREEEKDQLATFVQQRLESTQGACLYISGPPGTGKSAFVGEVCLEFIKSHAMAISTVNCMSIKTAKDLASTLSKDLDLNNFSGRTADLDFLRANFFNGEVHKKYLVILDEIDRLVDLDLKLLYTLFEWSMEPSSSLILIGIANALDLTDRFLPRLKSRNLKPDLLPFMPYTAPQIANIITSKLKSLTVASPPAESSFIPFLHPAAIQFCSKKVASQTGDLRKAFDICRRAIDMVESETKVEQARIRLQQTPSKTPLKENKNLASPAAIKKNPLKDPRQTTLISSISHLTLESAPRATIAHVAKVTAAVFSNGASQRLASLNLQQKAVLCSLSALEKKKREAPSVVTFPMTPSKHANAAPTIRQLYEAYSTLCNRENLLHALSSVEFRDVVSGLETLSLISAVEAKGASSFSMLPTPSRTPSRRSKSGFTGAATGDDRRMAACVGHAELVAALKGPGSDILREMIEGDGIVA
jgi:cell division control protein 6